MKSSFYFILGVKFSFKNIYCWKSQIFKLIFSLFKNKIKVIFIILCFFFPTKKLVKIKIKINSPKHKSSNLTNFLRFI